ncbi:MAG: asparagine synthase (glutamine-hydrolyzing) [Acidobacteria bacterium]|nr:asparagine synthase (glutamine-hydrolyzing) [Acidobacteriota bacterium]
MRVSVSGVLLGTHQIAILAAGALLMCGIGLILRSHGAAPLSRSTLARMHDDLRHRGPDGEGLLVVSESMEGTRYDFIRAIPEKELARARLVLSFRRLRIIDLDPGADAPLRRGRRWIALNGEIYNYVELRDELEREGIELSTRSDTEVALAAWERWGDDAFRRFRGMWAIFIIDLERGVLVGSRDRLGIKPMYVSAGTSRIVFGSEPATVARASDSGPRVDSYRLVEFMRGLPPQDRDGTFFEGVGPVPAASIFEIDLRDPRPPVFREFWQLEGGVDENADAGQSVTELRSLLGRSVGEHLRADVPVGILLSGGLDSSTLARLAVARLDRPVVSFTFAHKDSRLDETEFARAVIEQGGIDATFDLFSPHEGWSLARDVVMAQGEPLLGFDLLAHYRIYQMTSEHGLKVVLDGAGADEIFAGYGFYEKAHLVDLIRRGQLRAAMRDLIGAARRDGRWALRMAASVLRGELIRRRVPSYGWLDGAVETPLARWEDGPFDEALNSILFSQTFRTNLPSTLEHQDRNSMAHGVEARVPYLDHRIVELAFRLPARLKVAGGERKRVLLETARGIVSPKVTERRAKRAIVSSNEWIDLREHREQICSTIGEIPFTDPRKLEAFIEDYFYGSHDDGLAVWRAYTASLWLEGFGLS